MDRLDTWWLLILVFAALLGGLWWSGRMVQALYLGVTIGAALVLNPLLKIAFSRQPPGDPVYKAAFYAFPSGHTTTTTAVAAGLAVIFWPTRWRWPVLAAAVVFSLAMGVLAPLSLRPLDLRRGRRAGARVSPSPWPCARSCRGRLPPRSPRPGRTRPRARGPQAGAPLPIAAAPAFAAASPEGRPGIDVVFLDWGNTLMVDQGMREGPMKDWDKVEAEAGAQEALLRLRARYRLVVATNAADSPAYFVRLALARVGLDDYIDDVRSRRPRSATTSPTTRSSGRRCCARATGASPWIRGAR